MTTDENRDRAVAQIRDAECWILVSVGSDGQVKVSQSMNTVGGEGMRDAMAMVQTTSAVVEVAQAKVRQVICENVYGVKDAG